MMLKNVKWLGLVWLLLLLFVTSEGKSIVDCMQDVQTKIYRKFTLSKL
ncbi:hypothetical protein [Paenibacillus thalictri]|nr:hypothetical protein [Paenibacillus thalictri]